MPDPTDALSDKAISASKLAHVTHTEDAHRAAGAAHTAAFQSAQANRPSLASMHLQAAAEHDRHMDPSSPEGKASAAHRASNKAKGSNLPADHDAAAQAHKDAASCAGEAGYNKLAVRHGSMAYDHENVAQRLRMRAQKPPVAPGEAVD